MDQDAFGSEAVTNFKTVFAINSGSKKLKAGYHSPTTLATSLADKCADEIATPAYSPKTSSDVEWINAKRQ